jgi:uroporphyrinogen-III synthase
MAGVLVLRPEPGAGATLERARKRGIDAVAIALFDVEAVDWKAPDAAKFDGLLLTSANAIRFGGTQLDRLRQLEVYAVGEQTARAAQGAGFAVVRTGKAGIDRLLGSIAGDLKLLHLCGVHRRQEATAHQDITPIPVYRSSPIEAPDLSSARNRVALIHSPRAGRRFAELVDDRSTISIAAISRAAADAAGGGWKAIGAADQPTDDALLALAARLCNKPDPK